MKCLVFIQTVIYATLFCTAYGQAENWDTYMAKYGDKPGSVLVDMAQIDKAPDKRYTYLVITGPRAQSCDDQGMPAKEEVDVMEDILNATGNFITGVTAKVLVGTYMYNCERLNYYYVKDTIGIHNALRRMYDRGYKNYSYSVRIKYDPAWTVYRTFLYPGEEMLNWMENTKIITKMMQEGDSLTTKRDINFDLYFHSDTARSAFSAYATSNGYKISKLIESRSKPVTYAIVISKHALVNPDEINKMTAALKEQAAKHNGVFSGWNAKK